MSIGARSSRVGKYVLPTHARVRRVATPSAPGSRPPVVQFVPRGSISNHNVGRSRAMTAAVRGAAVIAVAILAAGCGGGGSKAFTLSDAKRIAGVRPVAPGWTWPPTAGESRVHGSTAMSEWEDDNKLAHVDVEVHHSASAAHHAMAPFNALSRRYARREGYILGEEDVSDLGDDAWRLRIGGNGPEVTYHWRRRNLVLEAHMQCFGACPADFAAAARAWAEAVDAEAH